MTTESRTMNLASGSYVIAVLAVTGVFALISAVLIAWPALAYLGSKLF